MARVGMFGGSFNPVHMAHLILAEHVREERELDKVVFVPASRPPHKPQTPLAPARERLEMLRLAVAHNPHFEVSAVELAREGPSYTLLTARELASALAADEQLYLIVGSDSLRDMPHWWHVDELVQEVRLICVERPEAPLDFLPRLEERFGAEVAAQIREGMVEAPLLEISSSRIRQRIAEGRSIRYFVPEPVREHILARGLYRQG